MIGDAAVLINEVRQGLTVLLSATNAAVGKPSAFDHGLWKLSL